MTSDDQKVCPRVQPDNHAFLKLARATMPFGKYAGRRLVDLPEPYIVWLARKGFPEGELGEMLSKKGDGSIYRCYTEENRTVPFLR